MKNRDKRTALTFALATVFGSAFANAIVYVILSATLNEVADSCHMTTGMFAFLFQIRSAGYLLSALAGGLFADRKGKMPTIATGLVFLSVGLSLFALVHTPLLAKIAVLAMGIGLGFIEGTGAAVVLDLYEGHRQTAMLNWSQMAFALGAIMTPILTGNMIKAGMTWQSCYFAGTFICALSVIFAVLSMRMSERKVQTHKENAANLRKVLTDGDVITASIAMLLYEGAVGGPSSWLTVYFKHDLKATPIIATYSLAVFWIGICFGRFIGGWLAKHIRELSFLRWTNLLTAAAISVLLMQSAPKPAIIITFAAGVFMGPIFALIAALPRDACEHGSGKVMGTVVTIGGIGAVIFPPAMGWLAEAYGMRSALWLDVAILVAILVIFLFRSEKRPDAGEA